MILDYLMHLMWLPFELQRSDKVADPSHSRHPGWAVPAYGNALVSTHEFFSLLSYINFKHDSEIAVIHDQPARMSTV